MHKNGEQYKYIFDCKKYIKNIENVKDRVKLTAQSFTVTTVKWVRNSYIYLISNTIDWQTLFWLSEVPVV